MSKRTVCFEYIFFSLKDDAPNNFFYNLSIPRLNCFRHLQILIDDRSWCLLSSQKCVSHFIGIWNCYLTNCAFGFSMELMFLWDAIKHLLLPCRVKSVERSNFRPIFQCGKLCRSTFLSNIYHFFGNFSLFK